MLITTAPRRHSDFSAASCAVLRLRFICPHPLTAYTMMEIKLPRKAPITEPKHTASMISCNCVMIDPPLGQEVIVEFGSEIIHCRGLAAERIAVFDLLNVA